MNEKLCGKNKDLSRNCVKECVSVGRILLLQQGSFSIVPGVGGGGVGQGRRLIKTKCFSPRATYQSARLSVRVFGNADKIAGRYQD